MCLVCSDSCLSPTQTEHLLVYSVSPASLGRSGCAARQKCFFGPARLLETVGRCPDLDPQRSEQNSRVGTVSRYSHYDVVAAGKGWNSDPWTMRAEDGYFYGRGVSDNKGALSISTFLNHPSEQPLVSRAGPLLAQIFAVRRLLQQCDTTDFCLAGFEMDTSQDPGNTVADCWWLQPACRSFTLQHAGRRLPGECAIHRGWQRGK